MSARNLSPTMRACLALIVQHGRICRRAGGFWVAPGSPAAVEAWAADRATDNATYFTSDTINSLRKRGYIQAAPDHRHRPIWNADHIATAAAAMAIQRPDLTPK